MLLSIVVPVFNGAAFLEKNINSLLNQDLDDYEIIIINDGSTDESESIALQFAAKFPQIKYFYQENRGLGGARNTGIEKACGEYVMFVDCDDWITENTLKNILRYSESNNLDLLIYNLQRIYPDGKNVPAQMDYPEEIIMSGKELILNHRIFISPCINFYRRNILTQKKIKFVEGVYFEDVDFYLKFILSCERVAFFNQMVYNYLWNDTSITVKQSRLHDTRKFQHYIFAIMRLRMIISSEDNVLKYRLNYILEYYYLQLIKMSYNNRLDYEGAKKAFYSLSEKKMLPLKIEQFEQTQNDKVRLFYINKLMFKTKMFFENRYRFTVLLMKINKRIHIF